MAALTAPATDGGAAPVAAAFRRQRGLVGREGAGQGARDGAAGDRAARTDRSVDHRRHRVSASKGKHSVGVARQYCGQLGKQANCQVAVSLSVANHAASLPVAYRLYLPEAWTKDRARRRKAGVPATVELQDQAADRAGADPAALAAGRSAARRGADRRRLWRDARSASGTEVPGADLRRRHPAEHLWRGDPAAAAKDGSGQDDHRSARRDDEHRLISVKELALSLAEAAWRTIPWREGSADWLSSRFARVRVRVGIANDPEAADEWLLIEWPAGENEPTKYWLVDPSRGHHLRRSWSTSPSCAGASSATIRNSSRRSGSVITKGADGVASITTQPCASRPTAS